MIMRGFLIRNVSLLLMVSFILVPLSWSMSNQEVYYSDEADSTLKQKMPDKWFAWDKAEHLGVSAFLSGVSFSVFRDFYHNDKESSLCFSVSLTLGLGLGKEFHDFKKPGGRFSYKDLLADVLGIGLGLLIATR
jgi:uncharacterized protein YfiM (DUF2279 family)